METLIYFILAIVVLIIRFVSDDSASNNIFRKNNNDYHTNTEIYNRKSALAEAAMYLSPYDTKNGIWRNLKLSNKYCYLKLTRTGEIQVVEKCTPNSDTYRKFTVINSRVYTMDELFDMFCVNFSYNKSYNGLVEDCRLFRADIKEDIISNTNTSKHNNNEALIKAKQTYAKTDINNASEVEITALPGISIVISKKIIKRREEIGGFKDVNEFFKFLNLKPHIESQLREVVFVTKMKGSVKIELHKERQVDL